VIPGRCVLIEIAIVIIVLTIFAALMLPGVYGPNAKPQTTQMPNIAMAGKLAC